MKYLTFLILWLLFSCQSQAEKDRELMESLLLSKTNIESELKYLSDSAKRQINRVLPEKYYDSSNGKDEYYDSVWLKTYSAFYPHVGDLEDSLQKIELEIEKLKLLK